MPERTACGALRFAAARPRVVSLDPGVVASVVSSDHVCGDREALEILDVQLRLTISRRQLVERITPHPTLERAAGSLHSIGHRHRLTINPAVGDITAITGREMVGLGGSSSRRLHRDAGEQSRITMNASVSEAPLGAAQSVEMDDDQERRLAVLLLDDCGCGTRTDRVPAGAS